MTFQYLHLVQLFFQHTTKNRFLINFYAKFYHCGDFYRVSIINPRTRMSDSDKDVETEGKSINAVNAALVHTRIIFHIHFF